MQGSTLIGVVGGQPVPLYPDLALRMKAGLNDVTIIVLLSVLLPMVTSQIEGAPRLLNVIALVVPIALLEPCLVSFRGATIGQSWYGMSVISVKTMGWCPSLKAYLRYFVKIALGGVSVMYMLFSRRQQAIHDHAAGTIVVFTNALVQYRSSSTLPELPMVSDEVQFIYPSITRRFLVFLGWYGVAIVLSSGVLGLIIGVMAPVCFQDHIPSGSGTLCLTIDLAGDIFLVYIFFQLGYLGTTGRLPGAKRRQRDRHALGQTTTRSEG